MKGFKQCDKGHFYKETLSECNYCPKEDNKSFPAPPETPETEFLGDGNTTSGIGDAEKTQVFPGETQERGESRDHEFDPDKTIISGMPSNNPGETQEETTQKRKLRGWLVTFDIEDFGIDFKVNEGRNLIGRSTSNNIIIQDPKVGSEHAILLCKKNQFWIEDELSSNGTFLNGEELEARKPIVLNDGDEIKMGDTTLLFKTAFKK